MGGENKVRAYKVCICSRTRCNVPNIDMQYGEGAEISRGLSNGDMHSSYSSLCDIS